MLTPYSIYSYGDLNFKCSHPKRSTTSPPSSPTPWTCRGWPHHSAARSRASKPPGPASWRWWRRKRNCWRPEILKKHPPFFWGFWVLGEEFPFFFGGGEGFSMISCFKPKWNTEIAGTPWNGYLVFWIRSWGLWNHPLLVTLVDKYFEVNPFSAYLFTTCFWP